MSIFLIGRCVVDLYGVNIFRVQTSISCVFFTETMAPAMKAKAMKAAAGASGLTASQAFAKIAEATELKPKQVKAVVTSYVELAAAELKKNGKFKLGGVLNMKLKKKAASPARKGVNPFTKEPCVFKAKPASKTVRILPLGKFKQMVN